MSGYAGDLSEQQASAFEKFKERTKDCIEAKHSDAYLLKFLRARKFDVQKSETMFREAMKWRKEIGADTILETCKPHDVVRKYRTGGFLPGTDKQGCPIFIDPFGQVDITGILRSCKKQELIKYNVWLTEKIFERCQDVSENGGQNGVTEAQSFVIVDLKGLGLRHFDRASTDMNLAVSKINESRYPEMLRKMIIVNAPRLFPVLWKIFSPTLHERTKMKVAVFSKLLKEVDKENLPACYGGTLVDSKGDPECSEWICRGGMVPEHYYNQPKVNKSMTTVVIGRGSTVQLDYEVKLPNSILRYEFCTDGFDVGFGIFRRTSDERQKAGDMDAILTSSRVNSHMVPEDGLAECTDTGTYVVRFDNTYSWTKSKTVHYNIELLEPQNEDAFENTNQENLKTE